MQLVPGTGPWCTSRLGCPADTSLCVPGTNFLIRAMAFQEANWSPTFTLTEDFALGMYLKMNKWHCRYVEEYLAIGEAPDQVRNCFQQRSRWTKVLPLFAGPAACPGAVMTGSA